ncbi:DUF4234 domain-containing protein [Paenibacillus wynnii]|uniref:DUF4234 domain-containing protein n=1 Tax=Paenibacillus wynnii TaxID=268407 RepID=UPI00278E6138|nr:DUF4234 domain-containing protein [Paenibacillus wynnii]MDQ0193932.1 hypothetical protein [Paenibacillus wynnii]
MAQIGKIKSNSYLELQQAPFSFYQPVWQFALLSILTFGVYDIYWYYKNWTRIKAYKFLNFSPQLRTVGLFIPIYNFFLIYKTHKEYRDLIKERGIERDIYPGPIVLVIIISFVLMRLSDPYWLLCFISTLPLAMVQSVLNDLWDKVQVGKPRRTGLRGRQILLIVLGSLSWIFILIGMFMPD